MLYRSSLVLLALAQLYAQNAVVLADWRLKTLAVFLSSTTGTNYFCTRTSILTAFVRVLLLNNN